MRMSNVMRIRQAFLIVTLATTVSQLSAQGELLTSTVVLDRLESTLSATIENAASEANIAVFNAATEARLLLQQWRQENEALLDRALLGGNSVVDNTLNGLNALAARLEAGGTDVRQATESVLDSAQQLTETLTLSGKPVLRRISPTYITPGISSPVQITVSGVNLDNLVEASLKLEGFNVAPVNPAQTSQQFIMPSSLRMPAGTASSEVVGELVWTFPHTSWFRRNVLGSTTSISFPVRMLRLPEVLAQVSLSYQETSTVRQTRERNQSFYHRRGGRYRPETCDSIPIRPFDGNKIDLSSVRISYDTGAYGRFVMLNLTPEGFVGHSCAKSGSRSGYKHTVVEWKEYRDISVIAEERKELDAQPLYWSEDSVVRVPPIAHAPELTIKVFDGRSFSLAGPGAHDYNFIRARYDQNSGTIVIQPLASRYSVE